LASWIAAVKPFREKVSLVVVPLVDFPIIFAFAPSFIALIILVSSSLEADHAHISSINGRLNFLPSTLRLNGAVSENGYPPVNTTCPATFSPGR
jgi:hypothetical protein